MDTKELRKNSTEELKKILDDKRGELHVFKFNPGSGKNKNIKLGSALKKDVARILTVINEKKNAGV